MNDGEHEWCRAFEEAFLKRAVAEGAISWTPPNMRPSRVLLAVIAAEVAAGFAERLADLHAENYGVARDLPLPWREAALIEGAP